jgi:hypothetical protein
MPRTFNAETVDLSHFNLQKFTYEPKKIVTQAILVTPENVGQLALEFDAEIFSPSGVEPYFAILCERYDADSVTLHVQPGYWIVPLRNEIHLFRNDIFQNTFESFHEYPVHLLVPDEVRANLGWEQSEKEEAAMTDYAAKDSEATAALFGGIVDEFSLEERKARASALADALGIGTGRKTEGSTALIPQGWQSVKGAINDATALDFIKGAYRALSNGGIGTLVNVENMTETGRIASYNTNNLSVLVDFGDGGFQWWRADLVTVDLSAQDAYERILSLELGAMVLHDSSGEAMRLVGFEESNRRVWLERTAGDREWAYATEVSPLPVKEPAKETIKGDLSEQAEETQPADESGTRGNNS